MYNEVRIAAGEFYDEKPSVHLMYDHVTPFHQEVLSKKFPDHKEYAAWNILVMSSLSHQSCPKLDFPEPDSVETFLRNLLRRLQEGKSEDEV